MTNRGKIIDNVDDISSQFFRYYRKSYTIYRDPTIVTLLDPHEAPAILTILENDRGLLATRYSHSDSIDMKTGNSFLEAYRIGLSNPKKFFGKSWTYGYATLIDDEYQFFKTKYQKHIETRETSYYRGCVCGQMWELPRKDGEPRYFT